MIYVYTKLLQWFVTVTKLEAALFLFYIMKICT
jgi:hypothetical protein